MNYFIYPKKYLIKNIFTALFLMLIPLSLCAKVHDITDNKDTLKYYLEKNHYAIDSNAQAVILFEKGSSFFQDHILTYRFDRTFKILNPSVASAVAMIVIPEVGKMSARNIKGTTYNLENGKVVSQKLAKADIVKDEVMQDATALKFALPSLKAGSIIHFSYTVEYTTSLGLPNWIFQHQFPVLFSEYTVNVPSTYPATFFMQTAAPFKTAKTENDLDHLKAGVYSGNYGATITKTWVRRNIPALKQEPFRKSNPFYQEMVITNILNKKWSDFNNLYFTQNFYFARVFNHNGFLQDKVTQLTKGIQDTLGKAKAVFRFVRDSTVVDENAPQTSDLDLKEILQKRKGGVEDINLLLVAMLRKAGVQAYPIFLHTTDGRPLSSIFPDLRQINYVAALAVIGQKNYFLDASNPYLPFGMLPTYCYNGYSRIVAPGNGSSVDLSPDELENDNTYFTQMNIDTPLTANLSFEEELGMVSAFNFRNEFKGDEKAAEKSIRSGLSGLFTIQKIYVDNLSNPDKHLIIHITAKLTDNSNVGMLYLNTFFQHFFDKNPFSAPKRYEPVDFHYLYKDRYILRLNYPSDFTVTNLPKSSMVKLADGSFGLTTFVQSDTAQNSISLNSNLTSTTTHFPASEYKDLQNFFDRLIAVQNSKIVLKKTN